MNRPWKFKPKMMLWKIYLQLQIMASFWVSIRQISNVVSYHRPFSHDWMDMSCRYVCWMWTLVSRWVLFARLVVMMMMMILFSDCLFSNPDSTKKRLSSENSLRNGALLKKGIQRWLFPKKKKLEVRTCLEWPNFQPPWEGFGGLGGVKAWTMTPHLKGNKQKSWEQAISNYHDSGTKRET